MCDKFGSTTTNGYIVMNNRWGADTPAVHQRDERWFRGHSEPQQAHQRRGVHTKFGVSSFSRLAEVTDFDTIVTDSALPALEAHRYSLLGPR
jgi:hypothetical protein